MGLASDVPYLKIDWEQIAETAKTSTEAKVLRLDK